MIQVDADVDGRVIACVARYCEPLRRLRVDTVVLGCTRYALVRPWIHRALGRLCRRFLQLPVDDVRRVEVRRPSPDRVEAAV